MDLATHFTEKTRITKNSMSHARRMQDSIQECVTYKKQAPEYSRALTDSTRSVAGKLLASWKQLPLELFGSPKFEAYISIAGGTNEKSKKKYVKILPDLYEIVSRMAAEETGKVGSFTY